MMDEWSAILRRARSAVGMSRRELAEVAGVSPQTVKSYELGLRHPSRPLLEAILDALQTDRRLRNEILVQAGFAPDGERLGPRNSDYMYTMEEAQVLIDELPWPAHVNSELMEVLAANELAERVWGVDLAHELTTPLERNMMTVATVPRFADRIKNWEEMVSVGIGVLKGHHRGAVPMPESATAYFAAVMERVYAGDPRYLHRLLGMWDRVPPRAPKVRWFYPIVWDHQAVGELRFLVSVAMAHEPTGVMFNDWIPLDGATWDRLARLRELPFPSVASRTAQSSKPS